MSEVGSVRGRAGLKGQPDCGDTGAKRDEGRLEEPERSWSCPKVRRMGGRLFCRTGPKQGKSTGPFIHGLLARCVHAKRRFFFFLPLNSF